MMQHSKSALNVQVIRSGNYGSMDQSTGDFGAFGASPTPPPTTPLEVEADASIQHNLHLSNITTKLKHASSTPTLPQTPSRLKQLYNAVGKSPYFRTISPQVSFGRRPSWSRTTTATEGPRTPLPATDISMLQLQKQEIIKVSEPGKVGVWGAGFSIINLFLGLGLLSFPYALAQGSFVSLAVLAFTCLAMSYTGKLIVRCFEEVPINSRTYHEVGFLALHETFSIGKKKLKLGNFGQGLVSFGILLEFIGALCMSTIFIWDNVSYLVPHLEGYWIVLICSIAILPTCWMLNVSELAIPAFLGCVCKICTVSVIVITFFLNTSITKETEYDYTPSTPTGFSVSMGIFILSYAGHACLPEIYTSMDQPQRFEKVLDICFIIMFFTYSGMALFGYLQYGKATAVIITENLVTINKTNEAQIIVAKTLIGLVILSCYFQVSPILSVVAAIPEDLCNIDTPMKKRIFRSFLFMVIIIGSWAVIKHLAILEAVTGSLCTMITSVICPSLFYFGLNRKSVSWLETILLFTYLSVGILLGIFLLYNDIVAVISGQQ